MDTMSADLLGMDAERPNNVPLIDLGEGKKYNNPFAGNTQKPGKNPFTD